MVLEASKEVPPIAKSGNGPIVDPLDEPANSASPIKPIRPPIIDNLDKKLEPHLPKALTRNSLGFSPVMFLFYFVLICIVLLLSFPLRRRLRGVCLRTLRDRKGRLLEEGKAMNGGNSFSRPPSPTSGARRWTQPLRRLFSFSSTHRPASLKMPLNNGFSSTPPYSPRSPPIRPSSYANANSMPAPAFAAASASSRSPSPAPAFMDSSEGPSPNGLSARSRNSSQKNLSGMVPRSRVPSGTGGDHRY
jgi:hypothetical protein